MSNNWCSINIESVNLINKTSNTLTFNIVLEQQYTDTFIEYALYDINDTILVNFTRLENNSNILSQNANYTINYINPNEVCFVDFRLVKPCTESGSEDYSGGSGSQDTSGGSLSGSEESGTGSGSGFVFPPAPKSASLYSWGVNQSALGLGTTGGNEVLVPNRVGNDSNWNTVIAGPAYSAAINDNGELYVWGDNRFGTLGLGSLWTSNPNDYIPNQVTTPTRLGTAINWIDGTFGITTFHMINSLGELYAAGRGWRGDGGSVENDGIEPYLVRIDASNSWRQIYAALDRIIAVTTDGKIYIWGQLAANLSVWGVGLPSALPIDPSNFNFPNRVGNANNWIKAVTNVNDSILALNSLGEIYTMGYNGSRCLLGNGSTDISERIFEFTRVGSANNWTDIGADSDTFFAINSNNELYSWGGVNGSDGRNASSLQDRASPGIVGAGIDWEKLAGQSSLTHLPITVSKDFYFWGNFNSTGIGFSSTPATTSLFSDYWVLHSAVGFNGNHRLIVAEPKVIPPEGEIPCIERKIGEIIIQYSNTQGPCPGGHVCDYAVFDFYLNGQNIGEANLNNRNDGGDRIAELPVPSEIEPDEQGQYTFELRCKLPAAGPWSGCHTGIAWITIKDTSGVTMVSTCIPNDTVITSCVQSGSGSESGGSSSGSESGGSSGSGSESGGNGSESGQPFVLFDASSWNNGQVPTPIANLLDEASEEWSYLLRLDPSMVNDIRGTEPSWNGITLHSYNEIEDPSEPWLASCGIEYYYDFGDLRRVSGYSFNLNINTYYYNGNQSFDWAKILTHELGHALGLGILWGPVSSNNTVWLSGTTYPETKKGYNAKYASLQGNRSLIPVEDTGGTGSQGVHWENNNRTNYLGIEDIMIASYSNYPITSVSLGLFYDFGYLTTGNQPQVLALSQQSNLYINTLFKCGCGCGTHGNHAPPKKLVYDREQNKLIEKN